VVVSAPGKRQPAEAKITDLLYLCHEMVAMSTDIRDRRRAAAQFSGAG
jgi:hypothetical protein